MRRRKFLSVLGGALTSPILGPAPAFSQKRGRLARIGVLWHAGNAEEEGEYFTNLLKGFHDRGRVEGRNVEFEHRFADEDYDRFPRLAAELVSLNVDLLVAVTRDAAAAAQAATQTIPVVFNVVPDPVGNNFADSIARPGRNLTGIANPSLDVTGKRLELLKEALPGLSRVALLTNPRNRFFHERTIKNLQRESSAINIKMRPFEARTPLEIDAAFSEISRADVQAVYIATDAMLFNERRRIGALGLANRLPIASTNRLATLAGAFMAYGPDGLSSFYRVGYYANRILNGDKPGDLPIEQIDKFELLFNMQTAKILGITIPHTLIARADDLIE
jgi:putative ABC transport system substrate-binding protein